MGDSLVTTEIGSTDDIVRALLEYLVDPLLPLKPTSVRGTPSLSQHESVAKQMHATVLLYNYYQRKYHPEVQFLDFESFCKLFVTLKASLTLYMKSTHQLDPAKLYDHGNQLSLTEKAIMNACSVSRTLLDASEDISCSIKEWAIIKVAVLLVDSTKENCLLLFSSVTNGVWSVIEKDLDSESLVVRGNRKRFKISKPSFKEHDVDDEAGFQKAAFLAVKESTGINRTELKVLESNVAYTLSKEKTAARFYILQSTQAIREDCQVPIKEAIDSLKGPLVNKSSGSWIVTPAVEYFHLLPYAGIISDWFSREVLFNSLDDRAGTETVDVNITWSSEKTCKQELRGEAKGVTSNTSHNGNVGLDSVKINSLSTGKPSDMEVIETKDSDDKSCINLDGGKKELVANEAIENPCDKKVMVPGHCSDKHESTDMEVIETRDSANKSCINLDGGKKELVANEAIENPCDKKVMVPGHCIDKHERSDMEVIETRDSADKSCINLDGGKKELVANEAIENPCDKKVMAPGHCSDKHESTDMEVIETRESADKSCINLDGGKKELVGNEAIENPFDQKVMMVPGHCSGKHESTDMEVIETRDSADKSCISLDGGKKELVAIEAIENPCDKKVMVPGHCSDKHESTYKSCIILDGGKKALVAIEAIENPCDKKVMVPGHCCDKHESTDETCIILDGDKKTLVANETIENPCNKKLMVFGHRRDKHESTDKSCIILNGGKKALVANEAVENPCDKKPCRDKHESVAIESPGQKKCNESHMVDISNSTPGSQSMDMDENPVGCLPKEAIENPCNKKVMVPGHSSDKHESADKSCIILDGGKKAPVANEAVENPCDKKVMVPGHCRDKHESIAIESPRQKKCIESHMVDISNPTPGSQSMDMDENLVGCLPKEAIENPCDKKVMIPGHCSDKHESADQSCIILDEGKKELVANEAVENPCDKKVMVPGHCRDTHESVAIESPGQKKCNESHMVDIFNPTPGSQSMDMDENPVGCLPKEKITTRTPKSVIVYQSQKRRGTSTPSADCYSSYSTNGMKIQAEQETNLNTEPADLKTESCPSEFRNEEVDTEKMSCDVSPNLHGTRTEDRSLVPFEPKMSYEEKLQVTFASKETALSQTALRVLVRKREKLCNELHNLEDEMAVCERNIQAILDGAENNLAIKLEAILDCCNDMCFPSKGKAQYGMNQDADNQRLLQYPMGKRLSEAILSVRTPCQELNDICCANNWMLPVFRVTPCDGGYLGNVSVKGVDFECSCGSEVHPTVDGARNMAAQRIIGKLQNMASQVQ